MKQVEYIRDNIVPKLTASDPHELRLAHEVKSMVLNAEMKLRASLFRTESRGAITGKIIHGGMTQLAGMGENKGRITAE